MRLGTPLSPTAIKVMLLGSGELGKEVVIELQRLGVEVIAVDRYADAPGQQVAHRAHVIAMTDAAALRALIEAERAAPHRARDRGHRHRRAGRASRPTGWPRVIPTARAAQLTMNREGIRRLAAEELGLPTSPYAFAVRRGRAGQAAAEVIGFPCFVKPVMSLLRQGPVLCREPRRDRRRLGLRPGGRPGRAAPASSSRASSTSTTRSPC